MTTPGCYDRVEARFQAIDQRDGFARKGDLPGADVEHPRLQPAFKTQPADDPAGDDRDAEPEPEIGQGDLPAEKNGLFFLPPYSPDRNPDELVWKHLKADTVGRMTITDKADFKAQGPRIHAPTAK